MNNKITIIVVGLILIVGAFYGGMKYGQSQRNAMRGAFVAGNGAQFAGRTNGRGGAGAVFGEILSQDANGITVKAMDGSSKIVLLSNSTQISKQASGTLADLAVGKSVSVMGTTNADGSVTAQSIQLRPAMTASSTRNTN